MKVSPCRPLQRFFTSIGCPIPVQKIYCLRYVLLIFPLLLYPLITAEGQNNNAVPLLSTAHSFLDGPDSCSTCHEKPGQFSTERCLQCHRKISEQIENKSGFHGNFGGDFGGGCIACHTIHQSGKSASVSTKVQNYDHTTDSGFDLSGSHANLACDQCHKNGFEQKLKPQCGSCHEDMHRGGLGSQCVDCHTTNGFQNASRAFHKTGVFPLEGRHLAAACNSCHTRGEIKGTPNRCYDCHWIRRQDDPFRTQLGNECEDCHNPISWTAVRFNHPSASGVVLSAGHRMLDCEECHTNGDFQGNPVLCLSCHQDDFQGAQNPNHITAGFSTDCEECHRISDQSFNSIRFNHSSLYPLLGTHATLDCNACHVNNIYQGTPQDCFACHQNDYQNTQDPNHLAAGFSTDCEECHRPADPTFFGVAYNHSAYQLLGAHTTLDCDACHTNNVYPGTPQECSTCHLNDYQSARDPNHIGAGYPTDCELCHQPSHLNWDQGRIVHPEFPINSGKHAHFDCSECHTDPLNYKVFSCTVCHERGDHDPVEGYLYDSQACYSCHPQGRKDD